MAHAQAGAVVTRARPDADAMRCIVCHRRFYSWAAVQEHEHQCIDAADQRAEFAERQLRDLGYPAEGDL